MTTGRLLSLLVGLVVGNASFAGDETPIHWKTECVGRMQISFPGEADVAAMVPKDFIKKLRGRGEEPYKFLDGQEASWSNTNFVRITHPITAEEKKQIDAGIEYRWKEASFYSKSQGQPPLISLLNNENRGRAWKGENFYSAYLYVGANAIDWGYGTQSDDISDLRNSYDNLLAGLRPRSLFDIPKEPGVCLPYLFIEDDGKPPRHIGTTYRLKDHPDITVWLEDGSAALVDPRRRPETYTPQYMAGFFWEQDYQNRRAFKSLWPGHKAFKEGTLAGRKGVKTFVELTRYDAQQTKDYGYLVAVRGDPDAREDAPDLMLYVIQDSVNATKRGVPPLGKDEFFRLAETIAASVRHRPVRAP